MAAQAVRSTRKQSTLRLTRFTKPARCQQWVWAVAPRASAIIGGAAKYAQQEAAGQPATNPGYDTAIANGQDFVGSQRAISGFAGGPLGNQVRALNNGVGHLQLYANLFQALQNGDMQAVNKLGNAWTKQVGGPVPVSLQAAASVIGPELTKILANNANAGTGEERQQFAETAGNLANSPEQTAGAIATLQGLLSRQASDLALQYHGATGRSDFAKRYMSPDVAGYLHLNPDASAPGAVPIAAPGAAPAAAPTGPTKIQGDSDYALLPSGAHFIGPDGHERIKP